MIELRPVPWADADAATLRAEQEAEVAARYGVPDPEPGPHPTADDTPYFVVAYVAGEAAGCGGLRPLDEHHGEVKRMYVRPAHRGNGVSTALLRQLEAEARARLWDRLVLETGDRQPEAMRLYEREGFTRIPNFGYYADSESSRCYELLL